MVSETHPREREPLGRPGPSWHGDGALGGHRTAAGGGTSEFASLGLVPAPYLLRVAGFVIDQLVFALAVGLFIIPVLVAIGIVYVPPPPATAAGEAFRLNQMLTPSFVIANMVLTVLFRWLWNALGWSPGKRALGLRTIDAAGQPPGAQRGLVRALWSVLSEVPFWLGYALASWDSERRTLHDRFAKTWVVRVRREASDRSEASELRR